MPLVRIALRKDGPSGLGTRIGDVVFRAMRETIDVPANDHFQIISYCGADELIYDPHYLGIDRSDGIVVIQITLNEGRTVEKKKALYRTVADGLRAELGIRKEDVFINLVEVRKENWSFGNGIAQYA